MRNCNKERDIGVDLIKVLAIFGVVVIHTCCYTSNIGSANWVSSLFWGGITRSSVPLFLMASGAIMLNPEKEITLKKLYLKNILRIVAAMIVWGTIYKVYHLTETGTFSVNALVQGIKEVLVFNQEFHFYYLHMILIVYIFLPVTKILTTVSTRKQLHYILILWIAMAIIYPTLKPFWPFTLFGGMTTQWGINMTYASIGYGILGYYLKEYGLPKFFDVALIISGFLFVFVGTYIMSVKSGYLYEHFMEGIGIGPAALAAGLFSFFNRVKVSSLRVKSVIIWFSKASFLVYLVHMLFLYIMKNNGITVDFAPYIISIPVLAVFNIILSCLVYVVLSHIPVIKKWII